MMPTRRRGMMARAGRTLSWWLSLGVFACACWGTWAQEAPSGGYVVGNFGISAQVTESSGLKTWIKVNPPKLGVWLQNFAQGELWVQEAGPKGHRVALRAVQVARRYPEYDGTFDGAGAVRVSVQLFAPLGLQAQTGFLPALILQAQLQSEHPWTGDIGFTLRQAKAEPDSDDDPKPWPSHIRALRGSRLGGAAQGPAFVAMTGVPRSAVSSAGEGGQLVVSAPVSLNPGVGKTVVFVVGAFDAEGEYTRTLQSVDALADDLASRTQELQVQLRTFEEALPRTGDTKIDDYLRWYASAGILLTKGDRHGDVLTMGYRELNPRDSFWTSGIHLVLWKDLERRMIQELAANQRTDGRIPVTILPIIDRGSEIDSNTYFVLRVARYYRWYRDDALLRQLWPRVQKAIEYLVTRDTDHVGVPKQISYWADWKDVPAVDGRTYAPYFALLWLASVREASELAEALHDKASAAHYKELSVKAQELINKPWDQGGLWNGRVFADRWADGRRPNYVLQDQLVGAYFDVIPRDRLSAIYQQLRANETPWGVRETFPYHPNWTQDMGGTPGNYHNGGIWPHLNFIDATGRYLNGRGVDAERIIHEVGQADLDAHGDEKPNEFLNGDTGVNSGMSVQGWNANLFSAIYFGAFGLQRTSTSELAIRVHIPPPRDFETQLLLPGCKGVLRRQDGKLSWQEDEDRCRHNGLRVTVQGGGDDS